MIKLKKSKKNYINFQKKDMYLNKYVFMGGEMVSVMYI